MVYDAHHRLSRVLFKPGQPVSQQRYISAEFVDDESLHCISFRGIQQLQGAHQRSEHATSVNVATQQNGRVGIQGHPHVDYLGGLQINLGRTAGPLDNHHIVLASQSVQR